MALLLPPRGRRELGDAALDLACEGERRLPHLGERPLGTDPRVHVDPLLAARLREADQAVLGEHVLRDDRDPPDVIERNLGHRVEVHPELVGMVDVVGADRPRVDLQAAERRGPRQVRHDASRACSPSVRSGT